MSVMLHGKRIANTRAAHQAGGFDALIRVRSGIPLPFPYIAIRPPDDTMQLDAALKHLITRESDWLVLTC